jgi:hypothetical protein
VSRFTEQKLRTENHTKIYRRKRCAMTWKEIGFLNGSLTLSFSVNSAVPYYSDCRSMGCYEEDIRVRTIERK